MKKNVCLHFMMSSLFVFLSDNMSAQNQWKAKIDSLEIVLEKYIPFCNNQCIKDSYRVDLLNSLAWEYSKRKPDEAIEISTKSLKLANNIGYRVGIGQSKYQLGWFNFIKGQLDDAILFLNGALQIFEDESKLNKANKKVIVQKTATLGIIGNYYDTKGQYPKAIEYYKRALAIDSMVNNNAGRAKNYTNLAQTYMAIGNYPEALSNYLKSLKLAEELNDLNRLSILNQGIGNVYRRQYDDEKALVYYKKALDLSERIDNLEGQSNSLGSIGNIFRSKKDYTSALEYSLKSKSIAENIGSRNLGTILINIANIYFEQSQFAQAISYNMEGLAFALKTGNKSTEGLATGNIGSAYAELKQYDSAEKYILKALAIAEATGDLYGIALQYKSLFDINDIMGNYKSALDYHVKYKKLNDSMYSDDKNEEITRLQLTYESSKKEALAQAKYEKEKAIVEIEKRKDIAEAEKKRLVAIAEKKYQVAIAEAKQMQAEQKSQDILDETANRIAIAEANKKKDVAEADKKRIKAESNAEKQKLIRNSIAGGAGIIGFSALFSFLFYKRKRDAEQKQKETYLSLQMSETEMKALRSQMNPHFIFNALNSIQNFLLKHKSEEANTYLLKFSKLMRAILENSQHSEVSLLKEKEALEWYMQLESLRLKYPFTYTFHIDKAIDMEETYLPPLILQPFIENSIWHGLQYKEGPGHIDIYIRKEGNAIHTIVEDNGIGRDLSKKNEQPLFINKESLGMKLTEDRLKILNEINNFKAQFQITDLYNEAKQPLGTKIELSLPIYQQEN